MPVSKLAPWVCQKNDGPPSGIVTAKNALKIELSAPSSQIAIVFQCEEKGSMLYCRSFLIVGQIRMLVIGAMRMLI